MKFIRNGLVVLTLLSLCTEMLPRVSSHGHGGFRGGGRSSFRGDRSGYGRGRYGRGIGWGWWGSYSWLDPLYFTYGVYSTWSIAELNRRIADLENAVLQSNAENRANYQRALDELREERDRR